MPVWVLCREISQESRPTRWPEVTPELSRQHRHGGPMVGEKHITTSRLGVLRSRRRDIWSPPIKLADEASIAFHTVGTVILVLLSLSSAHAEIEEIAAPDGALFDYSRQPLQTELIINPLYRNNISTSVILNSDSKINEYGMDTIVIPETVWSLDVSVGAHLREISWDPAAELEVTLRDDGRRINELWARKSSDLWVDKGLGGSPIAPVFPSVQIQVASCGSDAPEGTDLDYCDINTNNISTNKKPVTIAPRNNNTSNIATASVTYKSYDDKPQPPVVLNPAEEIPDQQTLAALESIDEQCVDGISSCLLDNNAGSVLVKTSPPATSGDNSNEILIDVTIEQIYVTVPPADLLPGIDLPSPNQVTDVDNPATGLLQLPAPPLAAPVIPETSTWIMMMIGFCFLLLTRGAKTFT